ncbi:MAG: GMP/IMP nucleotidase [Steroidobacteraceae bacterium]
MDPYPNTTVPDWSAVETVCLDMDGTVLDLRFDNLFWLEALPRRWGEMHGLDADEAWRRLEPRFRAKRGTLDWYCIDHWSEELGVDVAALKLEMREHIRYLPGAEAFLDRLRATGRRVLLTTNAHPISLGIKNARTGLDRHFDELVSSHGLGVPKESTEFWRRLERAHGVRPAGTLFVDDSAPVLAAARAAGVGRVYQVLKPDSTRPAHRPEPGVPGVESIAELLP